MNTAQVVIIIIAVIFIAVIIKFARFTSSKLGTRKYAIKGVNDVLIVYDKGIYIMGIGKEIGYDEIKHAGNRSYSSTETKGKSIVGRAIVGGVIGGAAGAAVGAMTGMKDKIVTKFTDTLYIETIHGNSYVFTATESVYDLIIQINQAQRK